MERITRKMLYNMINNINGLSCMSGRKLALDIAYGGYRLVEITNEHGGEKDLSYRVTARELYYILDAMENTMRNIK